MGWNVYVCVCVVQYTDLLVMVRRTINTIDDCPLFGVRLGLGVHFLCLNCHLWVTQPQDENNGLPHKWFNVHLQLMYRWFWTCACASVCVCCTSICLHLCKCVHVWVDLCLCVYECARVSVSVYCVFCQAVSNNCVPSVLYSKMYLNVSQNMLLSEISRIKLILAILVFAR